MKNCLQSGGYAHPFMHMVAFYSGAQLHDRTKTHGDSKLPRLPDLSPVSHCSPVDAYGKWKLTSVASLAFESKVKRTAKQNLRQVRKMAPVLSRPAAVVRCFENELRPLDRLCLETLPPKLDLHQEQFLQDSKSMSCRSKNIL
jgi:hypothetical protein